MMHLPAVLVVPACGFVPWARAQVSDLTLLGRDVIGLGILGLIGWGLWRGAKSGHVMGAILGALIVGSLATWTVGSGTLWGAHQVVGATHSAQVSALIDGSTPPQSTDASGGACP